jgi:hypothetical protein
MVRNIVLFQYDAYLVILKEEYEAFIDKSCSWGYDLPFLPLFFANKGLDAITLVNILHHKSVRAMVPPYFKLNRVMASKPLLAKKSGRKGKFSFSFPHIVTGLKSLWEPLSSTITVE